MRGCSGMICFGQVATKTQITAEQYLHMTFEHDAEFVHGEIVERSMPDYIHARLQFLILLRLGSLIERYPVYPAPELRLRIAQDVFRIPDISVFVGEKPTERVPDTPPAIAIEILSKDDRHSDLMQKLEEYRTWGVQNIWIVDPATKRFSVYTELGLQNVSSFNLAGYPFQLTQPELFADL
jgi:Uma2 family endonuclease